MASPPQTAANGEKPQRRGEVHLTTKSMYGHRPLNGLPPDVPSWGTMLSREGRQYMEMVPRLAMWPGVALTLVVYCLNMVGDALRDPRLRGGGGRSGTNSGAHGARPGIPRGTAQGRGRLPASR